MRREVEGKPEHPRRTELRNAERNASFGPDTSTIRFLYLRDDRWRRLQDEVISNIDGSRGTQFYDNGESPDYRWRLAPLQLTIGDRGADSPSSTSQSIIEMRYRIRLHMFQIEVPLGESAVSAIEVQSWNASERSFDAIVSWPHGFVFENHGILGADSQIRILESRVLKSPVEDIERSLTRFAHFEPASEFAPTALSVELVEPNGERQFLSQLISVTPLSEADTAEWLRVPVIGQPDAVRGTVRVKSVVDRTVAQVALATSPLAPEYSIDKASSTALSANHLRWAGWVILCMLGALFVLLRHKKAA